MRRTHPVKVWQSSWLLILLSVMCATLACGTKSYRCPTKGMVPTLYVGDVFRARLDPYLEVSPSRGDIVVFTVPAGNLGEGKEFVKRIIGLPGETIEIRECQVFIDGELLVEPYVELPDADLVGNWPMELRNTPSRKIAGGECFVLGDNRGNSFDSRHFGPIELNTIIAQAVKVTRSDHEGQRGKDLTVSPYGG